MPSGPRRSTREAGVFAAAVAAHLGVAVVLLSVARAVFFVSNRALLPDVGAAGIAGAFLGGVRLDVSALAYANAPFLLSFLAPSGVRARPFYRGLQTALFLLGTGFALALELADAAYFPWALRRTGPGDATIVTTQWSLVPRLLAEFWIVPAAWLALLCGAWLAHRRLARWSGRPLAYPAQLAALGIVIALAVVGSRGGLQLRPVTANAAALYVDDPRLAPLVANTSLNWVMSFEQDALQDPGYTPEDEEAALATLLRDAPGDGVNGRSVVVIVMEGLAAKDVGGSGDDASVTPFLDSLVRDGLVFEQSYANGRRSVEAIAAIAGGVPVLMRDPWIFSAYQSNLLDAPPRLLAASGYDTLFFHGGNVGTMAFDRFAPTVGFTRYVDRDDYGDDRDYDGAWGIFDVPFFEFAGSALAENERPFLALLFSVSSHHPYRVEAWFEAEHPDLDPERRTILYSDLALQRFFEAVRDAPWFSDALFVITGDHTPRKRRDRNRVRDFRVPLLLYAGDGRLRGLRPAVVQHVDIPATVLDWVGWDGPFLSFGHSALDPDAPREAVMRVDGIFQILDGRWILLHDGAAPVALYDYRADPGLERDLRAPQPEVTRRLARRIEALVRAHDLGMLRNRLALASWPAGLQPACSSAICRNSANTSGSPRSPENSR